jgi:D-alanine-D-alanine ligase
MKITVWHPAMPADPSEDEADSLVQALSVTQALAELGVDAELLPFDLRDLPRSIGRLLDGKPDVVFNLVEETCGERVLNYLPPQILEAVGVPFTGNRAEAMALTTHKVATKALLADSGLPTPDWIHNSHRRSEDSDGHFLLKPVSTDASQGIVETELTMRADAAAARTALRDLGAANGNGWFAERFIDGREFNLSLIEIDGEPQVLPVAEMCFIDYPADKPRVVGYRAKWVPDSFEYTHTRRRFELPPEDHDLVQRLCGLAVDCWRLFHLRGYARVDFRVDPSGQPWILEVNTNPGIAPDAGLAAAGAAAGFAYRDLVGRIAESATNESHHGDSHKA